MMQGYICRNLIGVTGPLNQGVKNNCLDCRQYQWGSRLMAQQWPDTRTLQKAQECGCLWVAFRRLGRTQTTYIILMSSWMQKVQLCHLTERCAPAG